LEKGTNTLVNKLIPSKKTAGVNSRF
jgi:hypothetical protein